MNLSRHLRQRVLWKQSTGQSQDLGYTYAGPVEIKARVEEKVRSGESGPGTGLLAGTNIIVEADVKIGDLLATDLDTLDESGEPYYEVVEARESYVDRRGKVLGYKVFLEPVTRS